MKIFVMWFLDFKKGDAVVTITLNNFKVSLCFWSSSITSWMFIWKWSPARFPVNLGLYTWKGFKFNQISFLYILTVIANIVIDWYFHYLGPYLGLDFYCSFCCIVGVTFKLNITSTCKFFYLLYYCDKFFKYISVMDFTVAR